MNAYETALALYTRFNFAITSKIPVGDKHPNEEYKFRRRHATEDELYEWIEQFPEYNYGIFTGNIDGYGGIVVLEADDEEADNYIRATCDYTPFTVKSRRGTHYYFRYPVSVPKIKSTSKLLGLNLDIRASLGLVVGPNSLWKKDGKSGYYQPSAAFFDSDFTLDNMPVFKVEWIGESLTDEIVSPTITHEITTPLNVRQTQAREWLSRECGTQEGAGADNRAFALACELVRGFALTAEEAIEIFSEWGVRPDQLNEKGKYEPWTRAQLLHKLTDAENKCPKVGNSLKFQYDYEAFAAAVACDLSPIIQKEDIVIKTKKLILTGEQFLEAAENERVEWLVSDLIECGSFTIFSGKTYAGKSVVAAHLIGCLLSGMGFFGNVAKKCPVLYIDTDRNRLKRIRDRIRRVASDEDIKEGFSFANVDALGDKVTKEAIELMVAEIIDNIKAARRDPLKDLFIVVDTFRSAFLSGYEKGSESDSAVMMTILKPLKRFVRESGATLFVLHHDPKYAGEIAGSGAIPGVTDGVWGYAKSEKYCTLSVRTRDDADIKPLQLVYDSARGLTIYDPNTDPDAINERIEKEKEKNKERAEICAYFPKTAASAIPYEEVEKLHCFHNMSEKTIRKRLEECEQPGVHPRLETIGKGVRGDPKRYFAV